MSIKSDGRSFFPLTLLSAYIGDTWWPILRFFVKVVPWPICNQMSIEQLFPHKQLTRVRPMNDSKKHYRFHG